MSSIVQSYLLAILWAETDGRLPLDAAGYDTLSFSDEAVQRAETDLSEFIARAWEEAPDWQERYSMERLVRDFWLTRNGHGAGFWEYDDELGRALDKVSKHFGHCDVYVGDDGRLHLS